MMIPFTQATAVLHKYLNDELKILLFVTVFPWGCTEFPENSLSFPRSEKSLSIPGLPDLWPPWYYLGCICRMSGSSFTPSVRNSRLPSCSPENSLWVDYIWWMRATVRFMNVTAYFFVQELRCLWALTTDQWPRIRNVTNTAVCITYWLHTAANIGMHFNNNNDNK